MVVVQKMGHYPQKRPILTVVVQKMGHYPHKTKNYEHIWQ